MSPGRLVLVGVLAGALSSACSTPLVRAPTPPPVSPGPVGAAPPAVTWLPNGLGVVVTSHVGPTLEATLLFRGGALEDSDGVGGLTAWLPEVALAGTQGDPDAETPPSVRALRLGAELVPIAEGRMIGWALAGGAREQRKLLALLVDLAVRPRLSATRLQLLASIEREALETRGGAGVDAAVALASGLANGLTRPLPATPAAEVFERVTREDVLRQWRRVVRPERGVLVVRTPDPAGADAAIRALASEWQPPGEAAAQRRPCVPRGQSVHLVLAKDAPRTRAVVLIAVAAPGGRSAARDAFEAWAAYLGEAPAGPLRSLLEEDQARRAQPRLLDLGGARGGAAVLVGGVAGDHDQVVADAGTVAELLSGRRAETPLDADALAIGRRLVEAERRAVASSPLWTLVDQGAATLYPASDGDGTAERLARRLAPWHLVLVAVGTRELLPELERLGPVSVWSAEGAHLEGPEPPACTPRVALNPLVDTARHVHR